MLNGAQMTGLDPEKETIMSICCLITDDQLNLKDEKGWEATIHHEKEVLDCMDEWCRNTHGETGLTAACQSSTTTHEQAASGLLDYIRQHVPRPRRGLLAGNSVHCDKAFLSKGSYKPVIDHLSYRIMDVSSLKEAAKRWAPDAILLSIPPKKTLHKAREDIIESIEEAKYYRDNFFIR